MTDSSTNPSSATNSPSETFAVRLKYFNGQILDADDFEQEQSYLLSLLRNGNMNFFGSGIVAGLTVTMKEEKSGHVLNVSDGAALDESGRLIIWKEQAAGMELPKPSKSDRKFFMVIEYAEKETYDPPAKTYYMEDEKPLAHHPVEQPNRVHEEARISLRTAKPSSSEIPLATIVFKDGVPSVENAIRRHIRLSLGELSAQEIKLTGTDAAGGPDVLISRDARGLNIDAKQSEIQGDVNIDGNLFVGAAPPGNPPSSALSVGGENPDLAVFAKDGEPPVTLSVHNKATSIGFNARAGSLTWEGIVADKYAAYIAQHPDTGGLSMGTGKVPSGGNASTTMRERLMIGPDGVISMGVLNETTGESPVPQPVLLVGAPAQGTQAARMGSSNPLTLHFAEPAVGFNSYRLDDGKTWKAVDEKSPHARIELTKDGSLVLTSGESNLELSSSGVRVTGALSAGSLKLPGGDGALAVLGDVKSAPLTISQQHGGTVLGINGYYAAGDWTPVTSGKPSALIQQNSSTGEITVAATHLDLQTQKFSEPETLLSLANTGAVSMGAKPADYGSLSAFALDPRLAVGDGVKGTGLSAIFGEKSPVAVQGNPAALGFNAFRDSKGQWAVLTATRPGAYAEIDSQGNLTFGKIASASGGAPSAKPGGGITITDSGVVIQGELKTSDPGGGPAVPVIGTGDWTPFAPGQRQELGKIPLDGTKSVSYPVPSSVPSYAAGILLYGFISLRNNNQDQYVEVRVYTKGGSKGTEEFSFYMYAREYEVFPLNKSVNLNDIPVSFISNSENFWLPLPVSGKREVSIAVTFGSPTAGKTAKGSGGKGSEGSLYITGYR